jgi:hypothetical protein
VSSFDSLSGIVTRGNLLKFVCGHTEADGSQPEPGMYAVSADAAGLLWAFYGILCGDHGRIADELDKSGMHNPSGITAVELANWFVSFEPDSKTRMIVAMGLLAGVCLTPEDIEKFGAIRTVTALQRHMDERTDFYEALDLISRA